MIDRYSAATPDGYKVPLALQELGLPGRRQALNRSRGEQKRPEFESGAILVCLAEKTGRLMPSGAKA